MGTKKEKLKSKTLREWHSSIESQMNGLESQRISRPPKQMFKILKDRKEFLRISASFNQGFKSLTECLL